MTQLSKAEIDSEALVTCVRAQFQEGLFFTGDNAFNVSAEVPLSFITFWKGSAALVQAYYTLDMAVESSDSQMNVPNEMDVAAISNMTDMQPLCTYPQVQAQFDLVSIKAFSGLGASSVYAMNLLENPTHYVRGELGTLTTFVVQSLNSMPVSISIHNALAVHLRTNTAQQSRNSLKNSKKSTF